MTDHVFFVLIADQPLRVLNACLCATWMRILYLLGDVLCLRCNKRLSLTTTTTVQQAFDASVSDNLRRSKAALVLNQHHQKGLSLGVEESRNAIKRV
jgi:hypothetical protein